MIYEKTDNFFIQKINIETINQSRFDFFESICIGKKTLHVGCVDAMTFNTDNNLHIFLSKKVKQLFGFDIDTADFNRLKDICAGKYFSTIEDCRKNDYEIIIIPEVLEHVSNAKTFLDEIFSLNSKEFFISVPNIIHYGKEMLKDDKVFTEIVHPDHKCWFSPYTLYNIVKEYIKDEEMSKMYYLEGGSMIGVNVKNK